MKNNSKNARTAKIVKTANLKTVVNGNATPAVNPVAPVALAPAVAETLETVISNAAAVLTPAALETAINNATPETAETPLAGMLAGFNCGFNASVDDKNAAIAASVAAALAAAATRNETATLAPVNPQPANAATETPARPVSVDNETETAVVNGETISLGKISVPVNVTAGKATQKLIDETHAKKLAAYEKRLAAAEKASVIDEETGEIILPKPPKKEATAAAVFFQVVNAIILTVLTMESKSVEAGTLSLIGLRLSGRNLVNAEKYGHAVETVLTTGLYNGGCVSGFAYQYDEKNSIIFSSYRNFSHFLKAKGYNPSTVRATAKAFYNDFRVR